MGYAANAGFALLEISIALFVLSLAAIVVVPTIRTAKRHTRTDAVVEDLRAFSRAFQGYVHDHGDWPDDPAAPGAIPPGMERYLAATRWKQRTPVGGYYMWAANTLQQGVRYRAAIVIVSVGNDNVTADRQQLVEIDAKIDDGGLHAGNFRVGYRNFPFFALEQ